MEARRLIFHIDVNSAFLSWESVYRLSLNPDAQDLRLIPSAVGGDVSSRHGIILAKSTPAKKSGVVTAETIASALRKCPELIIVPSRFDIYSSYSRQMLNLLSEYTPDIEKFSIDEAFLDMTETIHLFGRPNEVADQIRERIDQVLKLVDLEAKSYKMPFELSGGEQQRLVIARALLNSPIKPIRSSPRMFPRKCGRSRCAICFL